LCAGAVEISRQPLPTATDLRRALEEASTRGIQGSNGAHLFGYCRESAVIASPSLYLSETVEAGIDSMQFCLWRIEATIDAEYISEWRYGRHNNSLARCPA